MWSSFTSLHHLVVKEMRNSWQHFYQAHCLPLYSFPCSWMCSYMCSTLVGFVVVLSWQQRTQYTVWLCVWVSAVRYVDCKGCVTSCQYDVTGKFQVSRNLFLPWQWIQSLPIKPLTLNACFSENGRCHVEICPPSRSVPPYLSNAMLEPYLILFSSGLYSYIVL